MTTALCSPRFQPPRLTHLTRLPTDRVPVPSNQSFEDSMSESAALRSILSICAEAPEGLIRMPSPRRKIRKDFPFQIALAPLDIHSPTPPGTFPVPLDSHIPPKSHRRLRPTSGGPGSAPPSSAPAQSFQDARCAGSRQQQGKVHREGGSRRCRGGQSCRWAMRWRAMGR